MKPRQSQPFLHAPGGGKPTVNATTRIRDKITHETASNPVAG